MIYKKKTALEKLYDNHDLPKVVKIKDKQVKRWGKGTIVIPKPMDVNNIMKKVPKGKIITINEIRSKIAKKYKATIGCPICVGIFSNISAYAAEEEKTMGKKDITPWWWTVKTGNILNEKYPGGVLNQKRLLEKEGYQIIQKGKKYLVAVL